MTPLTFRPGDRGGLISRLPGGKIVLIERGVRLPAGFGADARWLCEIREPTGGKVALARPIQLDSEWVRVRDARAAADAEREAAHAAALAKIDADARMHRALQEEAMALSPEALLALHPDLRAQFAEEDFRVVEFGLKGWLHCYSRITLEEAWARGWASHLQVQEEDGMPVVDFRGYRGVALVRTLSPPRDARALQIVRALPPEQLAEAKRIGGEDIGRLLAPAPGPGDVRIQLGPVGTALRDGPVAVAPIRVHVWDTDDDDRHSGIGEPGASAWRDIGGHPVEVNRWAEAGDPADLALRYAAIESLRLGALQAISPLLSPQGSTARVADTRLWESWNDAARLEFLELVRVATTAPASAEMTPGDRVACKEAMADPAVAAYFRLCGSELGQQVGLHTQTWVVNAGSTAGRYARAGVWKVRAPSLWDAEEVIRWVASQPPGFPVEPWDTYNSRDVLALRNVPVVTGDPAPSAAALGRLYASMPPEWREACDAAEAEMTAAIRSVLDGWAATVAGMAAEAVRLQAKAEAAEKARHGTPAPAAPAPTAPEKPAGFGTFADLLRK